MKMNDGTGSQTILIVDDKPENLDLIRTFFKGENYRILVADSGKSALRQMEHVHPDLILLDVIMPEIDGMETCRRIKESDLLKDIPVIFMTALSDTENKTKGFDAGAVDYITKPVRKEELKARVAAHLEIRKYRTGLEKEVDARTAELKRSEMEYRLLFDNANDAVFIFKESICIKCNKKAEMIFNRSREEIIGRSPFFSFAPEIQPDGSDSRKILSQLFKKGQELCEMKLCRGKDNYFDAEIRLNRLDLGGEECLQVIVKDITESRKMRKMEAALIQSSKMAEVGALSAGIVHEIKNPLAGIEQTVQIMRNRLMESGNRKNIETSADIDLSLEKLSLYISERGIDRMFEKILKSCYRIDAVIKSLLPYSRKTIMDFEEVNMDQLLKEILYLARFNSEFLSVSEIKIEKDESVRSLRCLKNEIQQVLINILTNSAQAMMEYSIGRDDFEPVIQIIVKGHDDSIGIDISDNGPGIKDELLDKVFEPFFTTKTPESGTGLGLFICRRIIEERHKGTLSFSNNPRGGVTCSMNIPIAHSS